VPRKTVTENPASVAPTEEQAATFDRLFPMLNAAHHEMTELSKKKQDGIVNTLKIKVLNRLLTNLAELLENDKSRDFVDMLDEESLPQNSDAALEQYRANHYGYDPSAGVHRWYTNESSGKTR
jgi:hypothetical protein